MTKEISTTLAAGAATASVSDAGGSIWMRAGGIVLAGSALVAVCAHLALPLFFTPVPL